MKTFHRENCDRCIRASITNKKTGNTIILAGQFAHEWSVIIKFNDKTSITIFQNRQKATKEYKRKQKLIK